MVFLIINKEKGREKNWRKKKVKLKYEGGKKENKIYKMFWLRMYLVEISRYGIVCMYFGVVVVEKWYFGDECIVFYISVEGILRMLIVCLYDLYSDKIGEWKSYFK